MRLPGNIGSLDWGDWAYSLFAAFIGGGASAVTSGFVVSMNDPEHYNLQTSAFYKLVIAVFLTSGLISAMAFLRTKPLPEVSQVKTTVTTKELRPGPPPVSVERTVEETHLEHLSNSDKDVKAP